MMTMKIKEFYNGCNIFITGGSGFMGKVLIEKLLRSCPGINKIYILMRNRKDKDIQLRVKEMLALPLFVKIDKKTAVEKLVPVLGDLSEIRLKLSDDDYNTLAENVSIVFHVAATIRFNEPIKNAILLNVRGTREVVRLAKQMVNLKSLLHVSTTFSNCNRVYVEEKIYESPISWQDAISIAEHLDMSLLEICTSKLLGSFPNTYTFTKLLAEQVINQEAINNSMPMVILRPSVVLSTFKEPVSGWVDSLAGPTGLAVVFGKGVVNVTLGSVNEGVDFMPADFSIKAMIVAAYHRGIHNSPLDNKLTVYNCSSVNKSVTNKQILQMSLKYIKKHPFDEILWRPNIFITPCYFIFYIVTITHQVLPCIFIDFILRALNYPQTINLVKLQQKIYLITIALSYFTLQTWTFVNTNLLDLIKHIPASELEDFSFEFEHVDTELVYLSHLIGIQKYLFHSDTNNKTKTIQKLNRIIWTDRIIKSLLLVFIICSLRRHGSH
ncbi:Male sterility, NAD-binding,NAD(P)-binding domain,Forkhead-associated (FHA) domain,Fatty acyl-CoA [Cinara cedri]|uniref:Fatty acyl-CoA reductase n=1 Tax=Cinara cedri TaxID=506608 RepID=A0A5E4MK58_9HEMI|nr:Male sterility, NAD-binding,NAD(P)-binding domain,Forkhead-associated (FHA) domain,Fatty acyl-CoA [Cinara cedri]